MQPGININSAAVVESSAVVCLFDVKQIAAPFIIISLHPWDLGKVNEEFAYAISLFLFLDAFNPLYFIPNFLVDHPYSRALINILK